jgi:hypothetical protein
MKKMPSKLAISMVMSYAYSFEQMGRIFKMLSKRGAEYFEINKSHLRYFVLDKNIKKECYVFGIN